MTMLPRGHHAGRGLVIAVTILVTVSLLYLAVHFDVFTAVWRLGEELWLRARRWGPFE